VFSKIAIAVVDEAVFIAKINMTYLYKIVGFESSIKFSYRYGNLNYITFFSKVQI
jgi:hypothetical protein